MIDAYFHHGKDVKIKYYVRMRYCGNIGTSLIINRYLNKTEKQRQNLFVA